MTIPKPLGLVPANFPNRHLEPNDIGDMMWVNMNLHSGNLRYLAMENGPGLKMYFLLKMVIFLPAMLVYQRVYIYIYIYIYRDSVG